MHVDAAIGSVLLLVETNLLTSLGTGRRADPASWWEFSPLNFHAGAELQLLIPLTLGTSRRLVLIQAMRSIQTPQQTGAACAVGERQMRKGRPQIAHVCVVEEKTGQALSEGLFV
jgi:hypothetical protein